MIRRILFRFFSRPEKKNGLALSIGYCFVVILVILTVLSKNLASAYQQVLEQERANELRTYASVSAIQISGYDIGEGMQFNFDLPYKTNVYMRAGNAFLSVYSSYQAIDTEEHPITLEGGGDEYRKAFDQQELVVVERKEADNYYIAAVAPIVSYDGSTSGLIEIMMRTSEFAYSENGVTLSWQFTILSIAVALTIVFYQIRRLTDTLTEKPDQHLPKIIRYGLNGCQSISFFSAVATVLLILSLGENIRSLSARMIDWSEINQNLIFLLGLFVFMLGMFSFSGFRTMLARMLTTKIALFVSVLAMGIFLIVSGFVENLIVFIILLLPIGFCLGMVFHFQREYRIYAGRLGYEEFSERTIHKTQYYGYLLGACVGAVLSGIVYERFGWKIVAILSLVIFLLVMVESMIFVQHCPSSDTSKLYLPNFFYALLNKKSGTFVWSAYIPMGMQLPLFLLFIPQFLNSLNMSLATVAFYYILFFFVGVVFVQFIFKMQFLRFSMNGRIITSAILQLIGLLILALMPNAKTLVVTVAILGFALGLHDFQYLPFYQSMIREDKQPLTRKITEKAFALGVIIGTLLSSLIFFFENIRIGLLVYTFTVTLLLIGYPVGVLLNPGGQVSENENL